MKPRCSVESVRARAFRIPTDRPEADGTLHGIRPRLYWSRFRAAAMTGLGYTYSGASIVRLIRAGLPRVVKGRDAIDPQAHGCRCSGRCAISARRAGRHGDLCGRCRDVRPQGAASWHAAVQAAGQLSRGNSDLRQRRLHHLFRRGNLREQLSGWVANDGCAFVKMKVGSRSGSRSRSASRWQSARSATGHAIRGCQRRLRCPAGAQHWRKLFAGAGSRLVRGAGVIR